jgi:co-chaperonin GroES (HSP10)
MKPLNNKIQLEINEILSGGLPTGKIEEHGTIIAIADGVWNGTGPVARRNEEIVQVGHFEVGKTLYFKAWAVDVITKGQEKFYFISSDSDAICAIE